MGRLQDAAASWRSRVLSREDAALLEIARAYRTATEDAYGELIALLDSFGEGRDRFRIERLEAILPQFAAAFDGFASDAVRSILGASDDVAGMASLSARDLVAAQRPSILSTWDVIPSAAVERAVGFMADGSPLRERFDGFGSFASEKARDAVASAIGRGLNPRRAARQLEAALRTEEPPEGFGGDLLGQTGKLRDRAELILRNETPRAHREASHDTYDAHADLLSGWVWVSALDLRTCPMCWAMHGTVHPLSERFAGHIQDRCTPVPLLQGETLESTGIVPGEQAFAALPSADQEKILGRGRHRLYARGDISLADVVDDRVDPDWGRERNERSLATLENKAASTRSPVSDEAVQNPAILSSPPAPILTRSAEKKNPGPWRPSLPHNRPDDEEYFGGKMKRTTVSKEALEFAEKTFGRPFDKESIARLVAAPTGSTVRAQMDSMGNLSVKVTNRERAVVMERTFRPDLTVHHDLFRADGAPRGTGRRIFARQVDNYVELGLRSIDTYAAGNAKTAALPPPFNWNGYSTWQKFGYNAKLPHHLIERAKAEGMDVEYLHDLALDYGDKGIKWWTDNGHGLPMVFDLSEGSNSRFILDDYLGRNPENGRDRP